MKNTASFSAVVLLLQLAALPCFARSDRRSSPPALEDTPSLNSFNSLKNGSLLAGPADPDLKILSKVPYDETIGGLTLRVTSLKRGNFISSFNLLPCMVNMLSTAFNAIWNEVEQHPQLDDDQFTCSENGLTLTVVSQKPPLKSMEYSDLVTLARMLLNFQQVYRLPGITFDYLEDGRKTGSGDIGWNYAASINQSLEQE